MQQEEGCDQCDGYYIIKFLGKGAYAIVKMGNKGQEYVAFKFLKANNVEERPKIIAKLRQEVSILELLDHPRIIKLIHQSEHLQYMKQNGQISQKIGMILELGQKGSMLSYLSELKRFDEQISRFYFHQLMSALVYMKSLNICHLDLKPGNIVFDSDFNLKITDFGFSKQRQGLINDFYEGTTQYMAPEILDIMAYDGSKVDVFAAGQILFVMITGSFAFNDCQIQPHPCPQNFIRQNNHYQFWNYQNKKYEILFPQGFTEDFKDLINKMFDPDFNRRITPEECLEHPWTKGQVANLYQIQEKFNYVNQIIEEELNQAEQNYKESIRTQQLMREYQQNNIYHSSQRSSQRCQSDQDPIQYLDDMKYDKQQSYKFCFENMKIKKSKPTRMIDEILIYGKPENLFCFIIEYFEKCGKIKVNEKKYKLNVNIMENNEVKYEIQIELQDLGNDKLRVDVLNKGEDTLEFDEEIKKFKKSIQDQIKKLEADFQNILKEIE